MENNGDGVQSTEGNQELINDASKGYRNQVEDGIIDINEDTSPIQPSIWDRRSFIIFASIFTLGIYYLYYVLIKKRGVLGAVGASFIVLLVVVLINGASQAQPHGTLEKVIEAYSVSATYTVPAVEGKDAVYESHDTVSIFVGDLDEGKNEVFVGEGIPAGTYKITDLSLDKYCSLMLKDRNDFDKFGGKKININQVVTLSSSQKLSAFNCITFEGGGLNVTFTPYGEAKVLEPAIKAIPAYDVVESIEFSEYFVDCLINDKVVACSELTKLDELQAKMVTNEKKIIGSIVEKLEMKGDIEKCYISDELSPCKDLLSYQDLKDRIIIK